MDIMKKRHLTDEQTDECRKLKSIWQKKKDALGLTQQKMADAMGGGITQGAVSHYLNGQNALNLEAAIAFSRELQVSIGEFSPRLQAEVAHMSQDQKAWAQSFSAHDILRGWIPLITYFQAAKWSESADIYTPEHAEYIHPTAVKCSEQTFALRIEGDSMTLPAGIDGRSFPSGMIVYVDPARECAPGDFVIARQSGTDRATFRRLMAEEGRSVLTPLNPDRDAYPVIRSGFEIIGRVIDASWGGM